MKSTGEKITGVLLGAAIMATIRGNLVTSIILNILALVTLAIARS